MPKIEWFGANGWKKITINEEYLWLIIYKKESNIP